MSLAVIDMSLGTVFGNRPELQRLLSVYGVKKKTISFLPLSLHGLHNVKGSRDELVGY